jgi:hypothetical protein
MYFSADIQSFGNNQVASEHLTRALLAFNFLCSLFGTEWVENELIIQRINDAELIALLGKDRIYSGVAEVERLTDLSENLQILKSLPGYTRLVDKLRKGSRHQNVDLEVTVSAHVCKFAHKIELEPPLANSLKNPDCRFQAGQQSKWVYVEATRKIPSTAQRILDDRGSELARLVSEIDTSRRCVVVLKKSLSDVEFEEMRNWLGSKPVEGAFKDLGFFFTVQHSQSETEQALEMARTPISVRSAGDLEKRSFGVCYLNVPDKGAKNKMLDKQNQLPKSDEGLLFIDVTALDGGLKEWGGQIEFTSEIHHFSAVVLMSQQHSSVGFSRRITVIENQTSSNPLSPENSTLLRNVVASLETPLSLFS